MAPSEFNFRKYELENTNSQNLQPFVNPVDLELQQDFDALLLDLQDLQNNFEQQQPNLEPNLEHNLEPDSDYYLSVEALNSLLDFPDEDDTDNWISPLESGNITQMYGYYSDDVLNDWPY